jgi:hypothetical protein
MDIYVAPSRVLHCQPCSLCAAVMTSGNDKSLPSLELQPPPLDQPTLKSTPPTIANVHPIDVDVVPPASRQSMHVNVAYKVVVCLESVYSATLSVSDTAFSMGKDCINKMARTFHQSLFLMLSILVSIWHSFTSYFWASRADSVFYQEQIDSSTTDLEIESSWAERSPLVDDSLKGW